MLDGVMRRIIDPLLEPLARAAARAGLGADAITLAGLGLALCCALAVATGSFWLALACLALSRLADGLDGIIARLSKPTDRGGFLDIVCDFVFYGALPLGFALLDPATNALPAAFLLFAFYVNGATFLAYAALAAKRGLGEGPRGPKAIHYTAGLAEGTETIAVFVLMLVVPQHFPALAFLFGLVCLASAAARAWIAWRAFAP